MAIFIICSSWLAIINDNFIFEKSAVMKKEHKANSFSLHSSGKKKRDILETMHVIISSVYLAKWVAGNTFKKARPEGGIG